MKGLIELGSGWWLMVGAYRDPVLGPSVALTLQYDPLHEAPTHGVKTVRLTDAEADELARQLVAAVSQIRQELLALPTFPGSGAVRDQHRAALRDGRAETLQAPDADAGPVASSGTGKKKRRGTKRFTRGGE